MAFDGILLLPLDTLFKGKYRSKTKKEIAKWLSLFFKLTDLIIYHKELIG